MTRRFIPLLLLLVGCGGISPDEAACGLAADSLVRSQMHVAWQAPHYSLTYRACFIAVGYDDGSPVRLYDGFKGILVTMMDSPEHRASIEERMRR